MELTAMLTSVSEVPSKNQSIGHMWNSQISGLILGGDPNAFGT